MKLPWFWCPSILFCCFEFFRVNLFWMSSSRMLPLRAAALAQWPKRAFSRCSASMVWCPSNTFWCGSGGHTGFRGPCSYYQYWVNKLIKFRYSEKATLFLMLKKSGRLFKKCVHMAFSEYDPGDPSLTKLLLVLHTGFAA